MPISPSPTPQLLKQIGGSRTIRVARPGDPEPYIFGQCIADPLILTANDDGVSLYLDLLWSVGEIEEITSLFH